MTCATRYGTGDTAVLAETRLKREGQALNRVPERAVHKFDYPLGVDFGRQVVGSDPEVPGRVEVVEVDCAVVLLAKCLKTNGVPDGRSKRTDELDTCQQGPIDRGKRRETKPSSFFCFFSAVHEKTG